MKKMLILVITHLGFAAAGFALGIYALPILMAPEAPSVAEVASLQGDPTYTGTFKRDLTDSDLLHWGEGEVSIGSDAITLVGSIAPGPDYRLYLSPEFVEGFAKSSAAHAAPASRPNFSKSGSRIGLFESESSFISLSKTEIWRANSLLGV